MRRESRPGKRSSSTCTCLTELIHGLGSRSTRHVMNRADLLVLEVLLHVADGYRQRYQERIHPPMQQQLPGME